MRTGHSTLCFLAATLVFCTCAPPQPATHTLDTPSCAFDVPATWVSVHHTPDGALIAFTNPTQRVETLRQRVRTLAISRTEQDHDLVEGTSVVAEAMINGALLRFAVQENHSLEEIRNEIRALAVRLARAPCHSDDALLPPLPPSYPVL